MTAIGYAETIANKNNMFYATVSDNFEDMKHTDQKASTESSNFEQTAHLLLPSTQQTTSM